MPFHLSKANQFHLLKKKDCQKVSKYLALKLQGLLVNSKDQIPSVSSAIFSALFQR